jgi:molybdopterin-guanine dinucleotide biosynthesis protein A
VTAAVILAGGTSRRFGADKLAARLGDGRSVLTHAAEAAAAVADELVIVVAQGAPWPPDLPAAARVVHDPEPDAGPLLGLAAGLDAITDGLALVIGGDMPVLEVGVLRLLIAAVATDPAMDAARLEFEDAPWASVLPCVVRREAARRACREAIASGDRRLRGALERLATATVPAAAWRALDPSGRTLIDIDRPADLAGLD